MSTASVASNDNLRESVPAVSREDAGTWIATLRRYLTFVAVASLAWEVAWLPLYAVWWAPLEKIALGVLHCTAGDLLIAAASILLALLLLGDGRWPSRRYMAVAAVALLAGLAFTQLGEWLNSEVRGTWAYSGAMPTQPLIEPGLKSLIQWVVIPLPAFWWAHRPVAEQTQLRVKP